MTGVDAYAISFIYEKPFELELFFEDRQSLAY